MANKVQYKAAFCEYILHEDSWARGEGKLMSIWTEDLGTADSIAGLLQKIPYLDKTVDPIEPVQKLFEYDSESLGNYARLEANLIVDYDCEHILKVTPMKLQSFMAGKETLYSLKIIVNVQKIIISDLTEDDLQREGWTD